jgi:putative Mg2+ transporter-C (MgtC) family protein
MDDLAVISELEMLLRLFLGFLAGAIIGLERSNRRQVAGLRTHILIATGATLLMLLSIYIPQHYSPQRTGDSGRIAAQVVSGIGFLGAGAIIRLGNSIRGLTTAASLWFIAAVGLVIGAGMYLVAAFAEVLGLVTLLFLYIVENKLFPTERIKLMIISYKDNTTSIKNVQDIIRKSGMLIQSIDVLQGSANKGTKLKLLVMIPNTVDITSVARSIKASGSVGKVEIKEKF